MAADFTQWLHSLPAEKVNTLRSFRADARRRYPDSKTPIADALAAGVALPAVPGVTEEFARMMDH